ncbi:uncharacterized protein LOC126371989 [Pectinophora gossypiella]|uniref:uncharacterized protein LOC126371989 n=1 Tax=Pectinophora gossypiella TaxID=13191 RepID=UPI00214EAE43|nr:uncharacterized protein LOC126371989 [Pectinophora gossypiella]
MEGNETPESIQFLFDITKQVKQFYETTVIFLTRKDYSDIVFNTMCNIRTYFQEGTKSSQNDMIDHIVDYHLEWLHAVNDIEQYKRHIQENVPREEIYQAVSFTIDAMNHRHKYYQRYMEKNRSKLSNINQVNLHADLEIVEDMHKEVIANLLERLKCFRNFTDDESFKQDALMAADELLTWIDKINDGVSMQLTKYINLNVPQLTGDLTKTLQQIVAEVQTLKSDSAQKMIDELKDKGRELSTMIRCTAPRYLEISKVVEKINILEDRINRLENEPSSAAVMALQHKKDFLEKRLASLENLKTTLKRLNEENDVNFDDVPEEELCACEDFFQLRIFNHDLPPEDRERLITELCYLWDLAIFGDKSHKSIISILSAAEMKEEFTDELGTFYIDENSRKIYKIPGDETLYQPNEANELVPLSDDSEHIYYFDECGRYFIDPKTRERIYKAYATASEYVMDTTGVLLKIKEERDGVTFYYDNFGRYYINHEGKHIYREEDSVSEFENDGLGNLVRLRSHADMFEPCPDDAHVTDDFKYLKCTVGPALRECIADVILRQPADPIKYLSTRLIKYRENMEFRDKMSREREEVEVEREIIRAEERAAAERAALEAALLTQGGSEASYDSNLLHYTSLKEGDSLSASTVK